MSSQFVRIEAMENFLIEVLSEVRLITDTGETLAVNLVIKPDKGKDSGKISIPLNGKDGLGKIDWYTLHPYITFTQPLNKVQRTLINEIRSVLPYIPKETQRQLSAFGTHEIDGEIMFNTGEVLIRPPPGPAKNIEVVLAPQNFKLETDPNLTERESFTEMMKAVYLSPDAGRIIFAHTLLYVMRHAYAVAWKSPCCSLFIYGDSGMKKTTYVSFLSRLHNRSEEFYPPRLSGSIPAAEEILFEKRDCVEILDDLFPSDFRNRVADQEKVLEAITRIIGDNTGSIKMRGGKLLNRTSGVGVIFTGEYLICTG
jgi:hypothetical protein